MGFIALIVITYIIWRIFYKPKETPIDIYKNSAYYAKIYPDIIIEPEQNKPENNITVNITNNHLHVYFKDEENQRH